jgi:hypothetical protein
MPTRNELLGRAQAMFTRTRSLDEIVDEHIIFFLNLWARTLLHPFSFDRN